MQDPKILILISNHLSANETFEEKNQFLKWLEESPDNRKFFNEIKQNLEGEKDGSNYFRQKLTKENMVDFFIQQVLGNLVGFAVGLWVTNTFTHYVTERKSIKNLFGLAGRKKVLVNETPEWIQYSLSFILGFIALELINYFFQTRKHILVWNIMKNKYLNYKLNRGKVK